MFVRVLEYVIIQSTQNSGMSMYWRILKFQIWIGSSYSPMFSLCPGARLAQAQAHLPPLYKLPQSSGIQGDKSALAPAPAPARQQAAISDIITNISIPPSNTSRHGHQGAPALVWCDNMSSLETQGLSVMLFFISRC